MELIQYKFLLKNSAFFEEISDLLFSQGAISVDAIDAKDSPIFSTNEITHPLWDEIVINSIFWINDFHHKQLKQLLVQILNYVPNDSFEKIAEQDWQKKWQQETNPCEINSKLAIYPSHIKQPKSDKKIITLDPGLSFGTGEHPTTYMCLNWISQNNITNFDIIDFGCGSGILSIASILFGAKSVVSIDNDPQALLSTKSNCEKNNIPANKIKTCLPTDIPNKKVDLIIANIYLNVLIEIKDKINLHLRENGTILLTGLLLPHKDEIMCKYKNFEFIENHEYNDWTMIVAKKHN